MALCGQIALQGIWHQAKIPCLRKVRRQEGLEKQYSVDKGTELWKLVSDLGLQKAVEGTVLGLPRTELPQEVHHF